MKKLLSVAVACCVLLVSATGCSGQNGNGEPAPEDVIYTPPEYEANKHALLIGCTSYPGLKTPIKSYDLTGPRNDVKLIEGLLVQKFGFPQQAISRLVEAGEDVESNGRPTRANIEREFQRLTKTVKKDDQVVISFSGHGSQQPDAPRDATDPEPDGYDEILLPADAQRATSGTRVPNAIVDDDLGKWLKGITDKGAAIWIIIDACQSGTGTRNMKWTDAVARHVPPDFLLPEDALTAADEASGGTRGAEETERGGFQDLDESPDLVAIYAALPTEVTIELPMPPNDSEREVYGILSYTLCHTLENAASPLTYRGLVDRIYAQYGAWSRTSPTPLVEGKLRDYQVLGQDRLWQRSILLSKDRRGEFRVSAGALHGFSVGTVFAVQPPEGSENPDEVLGYVRVRENGLRVLDARVEPCEFDGAEAVSPSKLPGAARCKPVSINLGDQRLRVAVEAADDNEERGNQAVHLGNLLQEAAESPTSLFQLVKAPIADRPEWLVRVEEEGVFLAQTAGLATLEDASDEDDEIRFGPAPDGENAEGWLKRGLERIARVTLLKKLAARFQDGSLGSGQNTKLEAEMLVRATEADEWKKLGSGATAMPVLTDGDLFALDLDNRGTSPADVSVLFIDSEYGIRQYYPEPGLQLNNRLPPSEGDPVRTEEAEMAAETVGVEQMIVIAVKSKSQGQPVDFSDLEQPGVYDGERTVSPRSIDEQLDLLFPDNDPDKRMRSFRRRNIEEIQFKVFTWRTGQ